jgi:hypothetical protein
MRLVTWNCRAGDFRRKAEAVAKLKPDVLVVQEVENIDSVLCSRARPAHVPPSRLRSSLSPRGTAVFSYTGANIASVDAKDAPFGLGDRLFAP